VSTNPDRWQRVEALCQSALERPPRERERFIADACGGDEPLRREVEALLTQTTKAERFLGEPLAVVAAGVLAADLTGRAFGNYQFVGRLGAGGIGEVYRARDTRLGREVAIKVVPPSLASDRERLARFQREARVLAALNHPHVGGIYGLEVIDGAAALVLELVEGETLAERIARGALPIAEALNFAGQIAEALDAAHE
jgi:eukaryotic-like serine/threonine-protein kinase